MRPLSGVKIAAILPEGGGSVNERGTGPSNLLEDPSLTMPNYFEQQLP